VKAACSILLEELKWEAGDHATTDDVVEDEDFNIVKNIKTNFVLMTLFLRCSDAGLLYGARTNYRLASRVGLDSGSSLGMQTMLDCAYAAESEEHFSNSNLGVMFYSLVKCKRRYTDTPRLGSISKEDVQFAKRTVVQLTEVHIPQASAMHVSGKEYLKVAYILNVKPGKLKEGLDGMCIYDFSALLSEYSNVKLSTLQNLMDFVHDKLDWSFFQFREKEPYSYNLWRLRSFFQVLTGVGVSVLEGSHRMTLAAKLLTGIGTDFELPVNVKTRRIDRELPAYSNLFNMVHVDVLVPRDSKTSAKANHGFFTEDSIESCRKWSQTVAYTKTNYIQPTWRDWIGATLETLNSEKNERVLTEEEFVTKTEKKSREEYLNTLRHVNQCVAEALIDKMPAKLHAKKAKRILKAQEDECPKNSLMDPDDFRFAVLASKHTGLTHNFFYRVRSPKKFGKLIASKKPQD
jgi:hypothetical protein